MECSAARQRSAGAPEGKASQLEAAERKPGNAVEVAKGPAGYYDENGKWVASAEGLQLQQVVDAY